MCRTIAVAVITLSLFACGRTHESGAGRDGPVALAEVLADPDSFDGRRIEISSGYFSSFEVSVLTSGFAESYPPQPIEPLVWVNAGPPRSCLDIADRVTWSERVVAEGVFRTGGGFGHLGEYEFELEEATLRCG